jgi:apolipoprotein N-acyltransferase
VSFRTVTSSHDVPLQLEPAGSAVLPAWRQAAPRRRVLYALVLLLTPVTHALAFPPARISWLAWVCFVPWFMAIRVATPTTALVITSLTTMLGTYLVASWLPTAVANYYGQSLVVGLAFFLGAWALTIAPWVWLFTLLYRAAARRCTRLLPVVAGAAWAGTELLRERLLIGDPFGLLGYSQVDVLPLAQIADLTGVFGISFVLAAVNAALAEVCLAFGRRGMPLRHAVIGLATCGALVAAVVAYGVERSRLPAAERAPTRVAIVQGNVDPGTQWSRESYGRNLQIYQTLTQHLLSDRPALIVWPESAMNFFVDDEPLYRRVLGRLLTPAGVALVAGGPRRSPGTPPRYYNSVFVVAPDGEVAAVYDKQRLLPFAEYFPAASIELLRRDFARVREFTAGGESAPLPTVAGPAGVLVCNEVFFGEIAGERARSGASYLLNLANDSWLGDAQYAEEAFDMARLRAIEQRRYVVRASTSGPSAVIDPAGRVAGRTATDAQATLTGVIGSRVDVTPYGRWGDVFGMLCVVASVAVLGRRRR